MWYVIPEAIYVFRKLFKSYFLSEFVILRAQKQSFVHLIKEPCNIRSNGQLYFFASSDVNKCFEAIQLNVCFTSRAEIMGLTMY